MSLNTEEKALIGEALQVYLQLVSRQMTPAQTQQIAKIAQGVVDKLDKLGMPTAGGSKGNKSVGISDEWYDKICLTCDKLGPGGCTDKITEKFPGKCDPILHYENAKLGIGRKN